MTNKKANQAITLVTGLIIAGALLFIVFRILVNTNKGGEQIGSLSPAIDDTCLQATQIKAGLGQKTVDRDNDGRDDSCDWCVCINECHNDLNDKDGDKLPELCDKNDDKEQGGLNTKEFSDKCTTKTGTLYKVGSGWQCLPKPASP